MQAFQSSRAVDLAFSTLLVLLLATALLVYWPGLSGVFLLDDIPNIGDLATGYYLDTGDRLISFVLSGHSGPLGRPLSMLSFLINDYAWPTDPTPFLYTNVLLHLLNGCLVFWLFSLVTNRIGSLTRSQALLASLLVTAIWLLHPLNVSTVLYVVQRMTELSSLFMLVGLVCYVKGRDRLGGNPVNGYLLMSSGIGAGLVLGALSKETAATLPLYVLALEHTILRFGGGASSTRPSEYWNVVFIYLPLGAVVVWHALRFNGLVSGYELRPFDLGERLLTEPRVLLDYLGNVLVPRRAGTGLFHDDFAVSSSLLEPVSTLPAIAALVAALTAAVALRKKWPIVAFAVLWFLAGHSFEAGIMPLELYFEHRNYLPMLGPALGLACFFVWLTRTRLRVLGVTAALAFVLLTAVATWQNTTLWGNPALLGDVWASEHPGSPRAQQFSAGQWSTHGRPDKARERIRRLLALKPSATSGHLALVQLNCLMGVPIKRTDVDELLPYLANGDNDKAVPGTLQKILSIKRKGGCPGLTYSNIENMLAAILGNDNFRGGRLNRNLHLVAGELAVTQGDFDQAVRSLYAAFNRHPELSTAIILANVLESGGRYDKALAVLNDPRISGEDRLMPHLASRERLILSLTERIEAAKDQKQATDR